MKSSEHDEWTTTPIKAADPMTKVSAHSGYRTPTWWQYWWSFFWWSWWPHLARSPAKKYPRKYLKKHLKKCLKLCRSYKNQRLPRPYWHLKRSLREEEIGRICEELSNHISAVNPNILVDCSLNRISFGEVGQYKTNEYVLSEEGQLTLFELLPIILETASSEIGEKWLKQVVI